MYTVNDISAYGAGYGTMSAAATSQYGVASTTAIAGQTPGAAGAGATAAAAAAAAGGTATAADYAAFNQMYGKHHFLPASHQVYFSM